MARKYNLISELYDRTCKTVVANPQNWQNFLQSACRNYKLRYDEQLLIYAQRPDATAVLEIERWNRNFGRWVNRGARGIAVFADEDRKTQRLSHYFDISDTHEGRYSRPVPLWAMQEEYTEAVIETLENTFGQLTYKKETAEQVAEEVSSEHYEYHLGDTVYIGASEYEILSFDDERVMLYDMEMPLFNKEFNRTEFDEKMRENPMNDHLKVPVQNAVPLEMLAQAKEIINEFCQNEYGSNADFSNLQEVGVAFTTITDDEIPIQVNANLVDFSIDQYLDGKLIESTKYSSMEEMIESALVYLDFDDLISITDEQLENVLEAKTDKEPEPIKPQWEKKRSKVRSFDLHPDIPLAERNTFDLRNHPVEPAGKKERFHRNMEAIRVLKECEAENRFATPAEQIILSKYVGWGGLSEAFDERNSAWADEFLELRMALSSEEYAAARESTLTAFYTPLEVTTAIYKAMEQMGFKEGNLLEPSCGIGNFIGMLPESMANTKIYGVELDRISAGIAQQLYQKSSIAAQGFEEVNVQDSFFDGVVGNVPFGDFKVLDKRYDKYNFLVHDYFFAKSLDKLRPGGVMALVTSKGTMDKTNSSVRNISAFSDDSSFALLSALEVLNENGELERNT